MGGKNVSRSTRGRNRGGGTGSRVGGGPGNSSYKKVSCVYPGGN